MDTSITFNLIPWSLAKGRGQREYVQMFVWYWLCVCMCVCVWAPAYACVCDRESACQMKIQLRVQ